MKIIINNEANISDLVLFSTICKIIELGKISHNDQEYCMCTKFCYQNLIYVVYCHRTNKNTIVFNVVEDFN